MWVFQLLARNPAFKTVISSVAKKHLVCLKKKKVMSVASRKLLLFSVGGKRTGTQLPRSWGKHFVLALISQETDPPDLPS